MELEGSDSLPSAGDSEALLGEIEEFLTGSRAGRSRERPLLTIVFTDIDGATAHAARLGDAAWRELLAAHDTAIRAAIGRFDGEEVKTIGDSFLVAFSGAPSQEVRFAAAALEAAPGEVLASGTTFGTVVGSGFTWTDRGSRARKGVPGQWPIFALDPPA